MTLYVNGESEPTHAFDRDDDARALDVSDPHSVGAGALCGDAASEAIDYPNALYRPKAYMENYPGALAGGDTSIARFVSEVITCPACQREAREYLGIDREARAQQRTSESESDDDERTGNMMEQLLADAGWVDERPGFMMPTAFPSSRTSLDPRLLGLPSWLEFDPSDPAHRETLRRVLEAREQRANVREGRAKSHPNCRSSTSRLVVGDVESIEVEVRGGGGGSSDDERRTGWSLGSGGSNDE